MFPEEGDMDHTLRTDAEPEGADIDLDDEVGAPFWCAPDTLVDPPEDAPEPTDAELFGTDW